MTQFCPRVDIANLTFQEIYEMSLQNLTQHRQEVSLQ